LDFDTYVHQGEGCRGRPEGRERRRRGQGMPGQRIVSGRRTDDDQEVARSLADAGACGKTRAPCRAYTRVAARSVASGAGRAAVALLHLGLPSEVAGDLLHGERDFGRLRLRDRRARPT
jgi:hypothetical protein